MNRNRLEIWTREIVERVRKKQPIEDQAVELKRQWPDPPAKAARQIAGLCNAARADDALMIVGLDEDAIVGVGADAPEIANWWPSVERCFDEVAPDFTHVNVPLEEDVTVVALGFDATRPPYVIVDTARDGLREAPWRSGGTRSARRRELLMVLAERGSIPALQVVRARMDVVLNNIRQPPDKLSVQVQIALFVAPRLRGRVVFPTHEASLSVGGREIGVSQFTSADPFIAATASQAAIDGPGLLYVQSGTVWLPPPSPFPDEAEAELVLRTMLREAEIRVPIKLVIRRKVQTVQGPMGGTWTTPGEPMPP